MQQALGGGEVPLVSEPGRVAALSERPEAEQTAMQLDGGVRGQLVLNAPSMPLRVLVACEYSGTVRDAFRALGHDAMSCDLLPTDAPGPHYEGDVFDVIEPGRWDLMVAHPPCTDLAVSGARWFPEKRADGRQQAALDFVRRLLDAPVPMIALENPVSVISSMIRKPTQTIQPWQFGHGEVKRTCLWLQGLAPLVPTEIVAGREARVWKLPPSADRWKLRSTTYAGIAAAMAMQWGGDVRPK
jgi:hypothetical protein